MSVQTSKVGYAPSGVKALPLRERPASRVLADSSACNSLELLATLIGGPRQIEAATSLLAKFESLAEITSASMGELTSVRGVGEAAAARIKAALQVGIRVQHDTPPRMQISSPANAAHILLPCFVGREQEYLFVLLLDTRNRLMCPPVEVYHGSLNTTLIRVGELFREAVIRNAQAIIMAHNHPSNDPSPSTDDLTTTRQAVEAGKLLDILLQDHLIFGGSRFVSLKEGGLIGL